MKTFVAGLLLVAGALWMSSCAPVEAPEGATKPPAKRGVPGVMHQGGLLDDELNFGRTYN